MEKASDTLMPRPSHPKTAPCQHVVLANYFYEPDLENPGDLLDRYSTIRPIAHALHDEGVEVTVVQRFHRNLHFEDRGVRFHFRTDGCSANLRKWQIPVPFHGLVREVCRRSAPVSSAIHVHGLFYPLQTRLLRRVVPPGCAIVAQHHAERPWKALRRPLQKWGLRAVDGFFFAASELADHWIESNLISQAQQVFEVMEGSTHFQRKDRAETRARTGLEGTPVVLWVGNLTENKDPLTVLEGFERILLQIPTAKLYMVYRQDDLLKQVRDRVASSPILQPAVTLLGSVAHPELEDIYNSADYFVLGSHYEGSGFALAEAMACAVVPVVTAIPSFLAMTDDGRAGACWIAGDSVSFAHAFLRVLGQSIENLSRKVSNCFERRLSFPAIARTSLQAYDELIRRRAQVGR
jgi:glycosyltransferase involved in cell wall biosynthesis